MNSVADKVSPRVVIVGGGISGLSVAYHLAQLSHSHHVPLSITVLEARSVWGGVVGTQRRDDFVMESGPDAFMTDRPWALDLCHQLGLSDQLLPTTPGARRSFIAMHGRLVPVPEGWYLLAPARLTTLLRSPLLSWGGRLRMACEPFIPARRERTDESVAAFVRRRFGAQALARVGQPMIGAVYSADPERLSARATIPHFLEMEQRYGSVIRALRARCSTTPEAAMQQASGPRYSLFLSLRDGLATLIDALRAHLAGVTLRAAATVERLEHQQRWQILLQGGERLEADHLCLALPTWQAAQLLDGCVPDLARLLEGIPYESVATVNLAFRQRVLPETITGFGVVVPSIERQPLVGCTFSSLKFPGRAPEGSVLLRVFVGGALHRPLMELDDGALETSVRHALQRVLEITTAPTVVSIRRFTRAMPQYHVGHLDRVSAIETRLAEQPELSLTGNGYRGMGLPDCIHQAQQTAERIIANFQKIR